MNETRCEIWIANESTKLAADHTLRAELRTHFSTKRWPETADAKVGGRLCVREGEKEGATAHAKVDERRQVVLQTIAELEYERHLEEGVMVANETGRLDATQSESGTSNAMGTAMLSAEKGLPDSTGPRGRRMLGR